MPCLDHRSDFYWYEMKYKSVTSSFLFWTQLFVRKGSSWNKQFWLAASCFFFHILCLFLRAGKSCLLGSLHAAPQQRRYMHIVFLCEEPEPHNRNMLAACSHPKWLSLWQQLLNSKFREALSTNHERRDARVLCKATVWWPAVAPVADCSRTLGGPCHLGTFCLAWCRKQLSLMLTLSVFFSLLTVNGISSIWSATELDFQSVQSGPQYLCQILNGLIA